MIWKNIKIIVLRVVMWLYTNYGLLMYLLPSLKLVGLTIFYFQLLNVSEEYPWYL